MREGLGEVGEGIIGDRDRVEKVRKWKRSGEIAAKHLGGFGLHLMDVPEI